MVNGNVSACDSVRNSVAIRRIRYWYWHSMIHTSHTTIVKTLAGKQRSSSSSWCLSISLSRVIVSPVPDGNGKRCEHVKTQNLQNSPVECGLCSGRVVLRVRRARRRVIFIRGRLAARWPDYDWHRRPFRISAIRPFRHPFPVPTPAAS